MKRWGLWDFEFLSTYSLRDASLDEISEFDRPVLGEGCRTEQQTVKITWISPIRRPDPTGSITTNYSGMISVVVNIYASLASLYSRVSVYHGGQYWPFPSRKCVVLTTPLKLRCTLRHKCSPLLSVDFISTVSVHCWPETVFQLENSTSTYITFKSSTLTFTSNTTCSRVSNFAVKYPLEAINTPTMLDANGDVTVRKRCRLVNQTATNIRYSYLQSKPRQKCWHL